MIAGVRPDRLATPWATGRRFLAGLYSFGVLIAMTAAQVAVVRLRIREPDLERPFRVPWRQCASGARSCRYRR